MISAINHSTKVEEFRKHCQQRKLESWRCNTLSIQQFLLNMKHHDLTKNLQRLVDASENFINKESLNLRDGGAQDVENLTISLE